MKKIMLLITALLIFMLSGCTATLNPLIDEDELIFINEDGSIRLEIPFTISGGIGRLFVLHGNIETSFMVNYFYPQERLVVYVEQPGTENAEYILKVSFEQIGYFKLNYDKMFVSDVLEAANDFDNELLSEFDETLTRVYDEDIEPLNYLYNTWRSEECGIYLNNDDLNDYYYHRVHGEFNRESIMMSFDDGEFIMKSSIDTVILSGTYDFDGLNIVLYPFSIYEGYPNGISLIFGESVDA